MPSNKNTSGLYGDYQTKMQKIADLRYAAAVLGWDQETYLPEKGAESRARQLSTLSSLAHDLFTEAALGELLGTLKRDDTLDPIQRRNIQLTLEDYEKNKKYPAAFVEDLSRTSSASYHAWMKARRENDYRIFEPLLEKMVNLKRKETELLGYQHHPYDALLDDFEKGATVAMLDNIFGEVRRELKDYLSEVMAQAAPDDSILHQPFDRQKQWDFGVDLLKAMGFDFAAGRQDISEHPFTTSFSARDVRVTTRIDENDFGNMTWSCIHEGGHALYEQGLPAEAYGLPAGEAASLGVHESQSRLWENCVGRSRPFWSHFYPALQKLFTAQLNNVALDDFYRAINRVHPSLIRTEADELTYHFHVMIRYEIEKQLITGTLRVNELPEAWNSMYREYLGVEVPDDRRGVLQDVHWSHGSFGYFPTYSLGSFYAAQYFAQAEKAIPQLESHIAAGDLMPLLHWLRENIHRHGRYYTAEELSEKVTGEKLQWKHFMRYIRRKYDDIYGLTR